jgi:hypothetical protein
VVGGVEDCCSLVELHATHPGGDGAEGMSRARRLAVGRLQTVGSTVPWLDAVQVHHTGSALCFLLAADPTDVVQGLRDRGTIAGTRPGGRRPAARCASAPGIPAAPHGR